MITEDSKLDSLLERLAPVMLPPAEYPPADVVKDTPREDIIERIENNSAVIDMTLTDDHWEVIHFLLDFYTYCCKANKTAYEGKNKYWEYIDCLQYGDCNHPIENADEDKCVFGQLSRKEAIKAYRVYRVLLKAFTEKGGKKHLYQLFPYGPLFTIHLLAQLPRLINDVDPHYGTAY